MRKEQSTNYRNEEYLNELCPVQKSMLLIEKRWTTAILFAMNEGNTRFSTLHKTMNMISKKVLAERINHLESNEMISKNILSEKPLNIEYTITKKGQELIEILTPLNNWGATWLS